MSAPHDASPFEPRKFEVLPDDLSDADLAAQWAGIEARVGRKERRSRRLQSAALLLFVAGAVGVGAWFWTRDGQVTQTLPQVPLASANSDSDSDGDSGSLGAGGPAELGQGEADMHARISPVDGARYSPCPASEGTTCFELEAGRLHVEYDAAAGPNATFLSIRSGGYETRTLGGSFDVELSDADGQAVLVIIVLHGSVELHSPNGERRGLEAGARWKTPIDSVPANMGGDAGPSQDGQPLPNDSEGAEPEVSSRRPTRPTRPTIDRTRIDAATIAAQGLWDKARIARRKGDIRASADAYAELIAKHPKDGRVGLAAFELGRMRLDQLGDTFGAIKALKLAVQVGGTVHEDALARLAAAYARAGRRSDCQRTKKRYELRYPDGVHAANLRSLCASENEPTP